MSNARPLASCTHGSQLTLEHGQWTLDIRPRPLDTNHTDDRPTTRDWTRQRHATTSASSRRSGARSLACIPYDLSGCAQAIVGNAHPHSIASSHRPHRSREEATTAGPISNTRFGAALASESERIPNPNPISKLIAPPSLPTDVADRTGEFSPPAPAFSSLHLVLLSSTLQHHSTTRASSRSHAGSLFASLSLHVLVLALASLALASHDGPHADATRPDRGIGRWNRAGPRWPGACAAPFDADAEDGEGGGRGKGRGAVSGMGDEVGRVRSGLLRPSPASTAVRVMGD